MTTTQPPVFEGVDAPHAAGGLRGVIGRRRADRRSDEQGDRGIVSDFERKKRGIRFGMGGVHTLLFAGLVIAGLGPLLWLAKSAVTPTQDTLRQPLALWPNGIDWANLPQAWNDVHIDQFFWNTIVIAAGSWFFQLLVATTAGFALSVLRPKYAPVLNGAILATLFIPAVVLLVPLYLTIVNPPFLGDDVSLLNNYLAVWLPAAANAFNILLVKRFFDALPREVFEAARTDGAGPFRLFWSIVLPDPAVQPLSVRLPAVQQSIELDVFLAALAISTLIPVVLFVVFQGVFLRSAGLGGAVKG